MDQASGTSMVRGRSAFIAALLSLSPLLCQPARSVDAPRVLSFEDRVAAQAAIERVYYSHQIATTKPFEEAVPRELIERKVLTYLKQSVALERYWSLPVTAEALRAELERIARSTRFPDRLLEIYAALGHDPILLQECFARPSLVDRLTRNFHAFDERFHGDAEREAGSLRESLKSGEVDTLAAHPARSEAEFKIASEEKGAPEALQSPDPGSALSVKDAARIEMQPEEYAPWRQGLPTRIGDIGPVEEDRDRFKVHVLLAEEAGKARLATWTVAKHPWNTWWASVESQLDPEDLTLEPPSLTALPALQAASCTLDDIWSNGIPGIPDPFPGPLAGHSVVWTGTQMIIWGGLYNEVTNTGVVYDPLLDAWRPTSTTNAPSARIHHSAVWTGTMMVVWGGAYLDFADPNGSFDFFQSGGRYDPVQDTWTPTSIINAPSGRIHHTAVWTGSRMIVWGGAGEGPDLDTGGQYDPLADTWTPTSASQVPQPRSFHTAVWTGSRMVVWGGSTGSTPAPGGGRYDPVADTWMSTSSINAPANRWGHTAVWTGSEMIIWGGLESNTGGRYDPVADTWTWTSTIDAPADRSDHTAVWTGTSMIVWGGLGSNNFVNTGGRYELSSDSWTPTSTFNAPSSRRYHTAIWTGSEMIVWGGQTLGQVDNTGGLYSASASDLDCDGFSEAAGDCNDQNAAIYPGAAELCDNLDNNCNGSSDEGTDSDDDGDGFSECQQDCTDNDASVWMAPSEPTDLVLSYDVTTGETSLGWSASAQPGALYVAYDVLRTRNENNFASQTICQESDDASDTVSIDTAVPIEGTGFFYLVRAENQCPASSRAGANSNGVPITARSCP